jgi:hypothetical protein
MTRTTSELLTWKTYYSNPKRKQDLVRPRNMEVAVQLVSELEFSSILTTAEEETTRNLLLLSYSHCRD